MKNSIDLNILKKKLEDDVRHLKNSKTFFERAIGEFENDLEFSLWYFEKAVEEYSTVNFYDPIIEDSIESIFEKDLDLEIEFFDSHREANDARTRFLKLIKECKCSCYK